MSLITLDFETYYSRDVGFSKLTNEEYINHPEFQPLIVSLRLPSGNFVTQDLYDLSKQQGREFFLDHKIQESAILAQNTRFDGSILNWYYGVRPKMYMDTMLMARALLRHKTGGTSLKVLAESLAVGHKGSEVVNALGKHREDFTADEWLAYREYCELDVALTFAIFGLMAQDLPPREFKIIHSTLRWYIEPTLELDLPLLRDKVLNEQIIMDGHLKSSGVTMDVLSSNKKFPEWLESMGVDVPQKLSPTTNKYIPAIAKADPQFKSLMKHSNPIVSAACQARAQAKSRIKETRMQRFIGIGERNHGKLPVPLLYSGAHTHRYAGDDAINLQNLPVVIREGIRAPKGHHVISADQGQIEARINAVLSGQHDLTEGFRNGEDVYSEMARDIYLIEDVPEKERKVGKATILGCGYGMGGERCYDLLTGQWGIPDISREFAQQVVNVYRTKMWAIKDNWNYMDTMLSVMAGGGEAQYGPITFRKDEFEMPSGMKVHFRELHHDGAEYKYKRYSSMTRKWNWVKIYGAMLMENVCQSLARELLADQTVILEKRWKSVHQIHDEIWFVVPDEEVTLACSVMKKIMEIPPSWLPELPLKVNPSAARSANLLK